MTNNDNVITVEPKPSQLQIRIQEDIKDDIKRVAEIKGLTLSALVHSLIVQTIRTEKAKTPELFPDYQKPNIVNESEFDRILIEAFDGKPVTPEMKKKITELVKAALAVQEIPNEKEK